MAAAMPPFMSALPRPCTRPSSTTGSKGAWCQAARSTGTTSRWPFTISVGRGASPPAWGTATSRESRPSAGSTSVNVARYGAKASRHTPAMARSLPGGLRVSTATRARVRSTSSSTSTCARTFQSLWPAGLLTGVEKAPPRSPRGAAEAAILGRRGPDRRSARPSPGGRRARSGRQELGAEADGRHPPRRGGVPAVQRATHHRRRHHGRPPGPHGRRGGRIRARTSSSCAGARSAEPRRPTSSSSGCVRRSPCSDRCSAGSATPGWRCRVVTTSVPAPSTCTSRGSSRWAPRSPSGTATSRPAPTSCSVPVSSSSSRASGATENLLLAAVLAKGTTVIDNAAREPEIADLAAFLNRMGANIVGAGSSTIEIEGVEELTPVDHVVIPDRIEAATYLAAVALAGGEITIEGARPDHMGMFIQKLGDMGVRIAPSSHGLWAEATGPASLGRRLHPALPGDRHRLQAAVRHHAERGRRRRHRDREPFRRAVQVRVGAHPDGGRHPHRGPPRRGPGGRPAVGRTGAGERHPGRSGAGGRRPGRRRRDRRRRRPPRRPGLRGPAGQVCAAWGPTWSGGTRPPAGAERCPSDPGTPAPWSTRRGRATGEPSPA